MERDQDNLRTEVAMGCCAFHELCSYYLFMWAEQPTGSIDLGCTAGL